MHLSVVSFLAMPIKFVSQSNDYRLLVCLPNVFLVAWSCYEARVNIVLAIAAFVLWRCQIIYTFYSPVERHIANPKIVGYGLNGGFVLIYVAVRLHDRFFI